jgi:hypothetical protein
VAKVSLLDEDGSLLSIYSRPPICPTRPFIEVKPPSDSSGAEANLFEQPCLLSLHRKIPIAEVGHTMVGEAEAIRSGLLTEVSRYISIFSAVLSIFECPSRS